MTQLMFTRGQAHQAIDEALEDDGGHMFDRWIAGDDDEALAYIVPADRYAAMEAGHRNWLDSQEVHDDPGLPPGYRPWVHSPLATTERLLPKEPMEEPLAHFMFGKKHAELDQREQDQVTYAAICLLLRVTLDPDGQGAVPVLAACHDQDDPNPAVRWQIAYVTPVPGLFTRVTGNGFTGAEWAIVTGSGWIVRSGYLNRELATTAAEALGRTLPGCDWMRLTPHEYTPPAKAAILAVLRRYQQWGTDDKQPEPEAMPGLVIPEGGPYAGEPATPARQGENT